MALVAEDPDRVTTILGGGLAGLAFAYFATLNEKNVQLFEAAPFLGGNGRTMRFGEHSVDTGAHRLHDRHPLATEVFRALLGPALQRVDAPSHIVWRGKTIAFPLRPVNAALGMGPLGPLSVLRENLFLGYKGSGAPRTFEELAISRYGPTLAGQFLLNYSEKLWGKPCDQLDPTVAGGRLKGLTLSSVIRELMLGSRATTEHLDGAFYYPEHGFGMLVDALVERIGVEKLHTRAPATRVSHEGGRVVAVEVSGRCISVEGELVSTIPLPRLIELMDPPPKEEVTAAARRLTYRHVRLCIIRLNQASVSRSASLYFPEPSIPFTRLYEPKNRSRAMAPEDSTAIVLEVPCSDEDVWWSMSDEDFGARVLGALPLTGLQIGNVSAVDNVRLSNAYPVLDLTSAHNSATLLKFAESFENLTLGGRAGTFRYLHTHDLFVEASEWFDGGRYLEASLDARSFNGGFSSVVGT